MDLERKIMGINSYLRTMVPASEVDDLTKEIAFCFYINKKYSNDGVQLTFEEVSNYERVVSLLKDKGNDIKCIGEGSENVYKSYHEAAIAICEGWKHYVYYVGVKNSKKTSTIDEMFNSFTCDELLEIINMSFENYFDHSQSTPDSVTELVLKIASEYIKDEDVVTDMTCGEGKFLLEASKYFKKVEGVEISSSTSAIAKIRLFANQIPGEIRNDDCFNDSWHHQVKRGSNFVFSEFPWKLIVNDPKKKNTMYNCNANRFILGDSTTTDYFFLSAMMNYIERDGVAITVMPLGPLSNLSDMGVRQHILSRGFLKEVIALPHRIFERTGINTALVVLSGKPTDKVSFFDATSYSVSKNRMINAIDVDRLLKDLKTAKESGKCYFDATTISLKDYSFSPLSYTKGVGENIPNPIELGDLAEIFTGWQVSSSKLNEIHNADNKGTKLLQVSNIENGIIDDKCLRYGIPDDKINKFQIKPGDVVISSKLLNVKSAVADFTNLPQDESIVAAGSIMVIRPNKGQLDPYYLVSYFESDLGKSVLKGYQTGVIIPNLSINSVKKIPVPGLDYSKQKEIGEEYRNLRDLISSERRRLSHLEAKRNKLFDNLLDSKEGD